MVKFDIVYTRMHERCFSGFCCERLVAHDDQQTRIVGKRQAAERDSAAAHTDQAAFHATANAACDGIECVRFLLRSSVTIVSRLQPNSRSMKFQECIDLFRRVRLRSISMHLNRRKSDSPNTTPRRRSDFRKIARVHREMEAVDAALNN